MRNLTGLLLGGAILLFIASVVGCAQTEIPKGGDRLSVDCRSCHSSIGATDAADFSSIFSNPRSHHSVGVKYPSDISSEAAFNQPQRSIGGISFFDRNGNGRPDSDEIQLYGISGDLRVECSSCHREHGDKKLPGNIPGRNYYLRRNNVGSEICVTCHKY